MSSPGNSLTYLLPLLTAFGAIYPAGVLALLTAMQVLHLAKNWDKPAT